MSDHDIQDPDAADAAGRKTSSQGSDAAGAQGERPHVPEHDDEHPLVARPDDGVEDEARDGLPLVLPPEYWERGDDRAYDSFGGFLRRRPAVAVAALTLAGVIVATAGLVTYDHYRQSALLAARAHENAELAQTVTTLNDRLKAVENAKGRDELADLRRSLGDLKGATASSRELSAAIAQLSQRVEKLDREQGAKIDKLGERVSRESTVRAAELAARVEKLEKKPQPSPAAPKPPKVGPNVSMEETGSIGRPRPVLSGYVVLGAQGDMALIGGQYGQRAVRPGDILPGAGRVERIERDGPDWVVVTDQGLIESAYAEPN